MAGEKANKNKIAVIADDLTGAADTGVQFRKNGFRTAVVLDPKHLESIIQKNQVLVITTESRAVAPTQARNITEKFLDKLKDSGITRYYKKIDSTLRGNIGVELQTILKKLDKEAVFLIPAFPESGRTTKKGYQYVNNTLLSETEYGEDLLAPVKYSYIPDILSAQGISENEIQVINRDLIYNNSIDLGEKIKKEVKKGIKFFVFDSETRKDLIKIAQIIKKYEGDPLISGCAGLAEELPRIWDLKINVFPKEDSQGKIIAVAGSVSETTQKQINYAVKKDNRNLLTINTGQLLISRLSRNRELKRIKNKIEKILSSSHHIILSLKKEDFEEKTRKQLWDDSRVILNNLNKIIHFLNKNYAIKGLILTGGDTAVSICKELKANGIQIEGEMSPGIPAGKILGGDLAGTAVITKAGGFGKKEALEKAFTYIEENKENK